MPTIFYTTRTIMAKLNEDGTANIIEDKGVYTEGKTHAVNSCKQRLANDDSIVCILLEGDNGHDHEVIKRT